MTNGDGWATLSLKNNSKNESEASKYTLSTTENTIIGRSPECQISLNPHEFITVSRRHAEIKLVNANWEISDLGTTNGTLVNDLPIASPQKLESGDRITLGKKGAEFHFECLTLNATVMVQPTQMNMDVAKPEAKMEVVKESAPKSEAIAEAKKTIPAVPKAKSLSKNKSSEQNNKNKPVAEPKSEPSMSSVAKSKPEVKSEPKPKSNSGSSTKNSNATISEVKTAPPVSVSQPNSAPSATPTASSDNTLWSLISTTEISQLPGHSQPVLGLVFSPDGKTIATTAKDKTIKLWNIAEGKEIATLTGHKLAPNAVVFSPDGKTLASGGADKTIKLWNVSSTEETTSFSGHKLARWKNFGQR